MSTLINIEHNMIDSKDIWELTFTDFETKWTFEPKDSTYHSSLIEITVKGKKKKTVKRQFPSNFLNDLSKDESKNLKEIIRIFSEAFFKVKNVKLVPNFKVYYLGYFNIIIKNKDIFDPEILVVYPIMNKTLEDLSKNIYIKIYNLFIKSKLDFKYFSKFTHTFLFNHSSDMVEETFLDKLYILNFFLNNSIPEELEFSKYWENKNNYELDFSRVKISSAFKKIYVNELNPVGFFDIKRNLYSLVKLIYSNLEEYEVKTLEFRHSNLIINNLDLYTRSGGKDWGWGSFTNFLKVFKNVEIEKVVSLEESLETLKSNLIDRSLFNKIKNLSFVGQRIRFYVLLCYFNKTLGTDNAFKLLIQLAQIEKYTFEDILWVMENYENPAELPMSITLELAP